MISHNRQCGASSLVSLVTSSTLILIDTFGTLYDPPMYFFKEEGARSFEPYLNELNSFKQTTEKCTSFNIISRSSWYSRFSFEMKLIKCPAKGRKQKKRERRGGGGGGGGVLSEKLVVPKLCLLRMPQLFFGIWNKGTHKRFARFWSYFSR